MSTRPETPIFTKSKVFFGLDKSKRALLDAQSAIVCEGQLDLIACFMAGVQNVVAPQGTAFTGDHARILKRYVDEVVLCFDSDEAGKTPPCVRSTTCSRPVWPFESPSCQRRTTRTVSSRPTAAKRSANLWKARTDFLITI